MSELIMMCVEEEKMIKAEKSDFIHNVIDGPKLKKNKNNGKNKNKVDILFSVSKISMSGTKYTHKCYHCKKRGHVRNDSMNFKD
jgi:hypothetical protein